MFSSEEFESSIHFNDPTPNIQFTILVNLFLDNTHLSFGQSRKVMKKKWYVFLNLPYETFPDWPSFLKLVNKTVSEAWNSTTVLTSNKHFGSRIHTWVHKSLFAYNRKQQNMSLTWKTMQKHYLLVVHKTTELHTKEMYYPKPVSKQLSYSDVRYQQA